MVSGPVSPAAAFPDFGFGGLPGRNRTGAGAPSRGFRRSGPAAAGGWRGRALRGSPGRPWCLPGHRVLSSLEFPSRGTRILPLLPGLGALGTSLASSRAAGARSHSSSPASPGYITLPLAVSWFQLRRLRPGTARGGAGELGPRQIPAGGPQRHRAPTDGSRRPAGPGVPAPPSRLPPAVSPRGVSGAPGLRRYVGWEVRAGGGEVEPRGPSPRGWSRTEGKSDQSRSRRRGSRFHLPPLVGLPASLKPFSKKLSRRPLSTSGRPGSVFEAA